MAGEAKAKLPEVVEAEIQRLEAMIARLEAGEEDPEDFRVYRLKTASTASGAGPNTT